MGHSQMDTIVKKYVSSVWYGYGESMVLESNWKADDDSVVDGALSKLVICVVVLRNGICIVGSAGHGDPDWARKDAFNKLRSFHDFHMAELNTEVGV